MEEIFNPQNPPINEKLPTSIKIIGWVTTVFGIAPTISLLLFMGYIFVASIGGGGVLNTPHPDLLTRILIGISAGSLYAIISATSVLGIVLLVIIDGFGILPRIFGLMLFGRSKTAWTYIFIGNLLVFMLYLSGLYVGFNSKTSVDLLVFLSPWPLWNLFVIWKLYEHNKLFGV